MKKVTAIVSLVLFLISCDSDNTKDKVEISPGDATQQIGDSLSSVNEPAGGAITNDTSTTRDTASYERLKQKQ